MTSVSQKTALVVGGGIAGASICLSLKRRNIQTILLEKEPSVATKASGNPIGVVYPFLTKHKTAESEFSYLAFQYFLNLWNQLKLGELVPHVNGIHFLLDSSSLYERYSHALLSHKIPPEVARLEREPQSQIDALYFSQGKAISPVSLTKELFQLANPLEKMQSELLSWQVDEADGKLICKTINETFKVDYLFLAQGYQFSKDPSLQWIPMKQVRGQIVEIPATFFQNQTSILYGDYLTAEINNKRVLGASFDEFHLEEKPREEETLALWDGLRKKLPTLREEWDPVRIHEFGTRVSFRTQSQDRHPVVGKLPNVSLLDTTVKYQNLFRKNGKQFQIPYYESVGILNGLGSRGLTHAFFAAEILVNEILNQKQELPEPIIQSLKPDRFLLRMWKRDQLT